MERPPFTAFKYSGGGVTLMQLALTDATRQAVRGDLRSPVLEPVGMTNSGYEQPLPAERDRTRARAHNGGGRAMDAKWHVYPEQAAAGPVDHAHRSRTFAIEIQRAARGRSAKVLTQASACAR